MISASALAILVYVALAITVLTPVGLMFLLIQDYKGGKLW